MEKVVSLKYLLHDHQVCWLFVCKLLLVNQQQVVLQLLLSEMSLRLVLEF